MTEKTNEEKTNEEIANEEENNEGKKPLGKKKLIGLFLSIFLFGAILIVNEGVKWLFADEEVVIQTSEYDDVKVQSEANTTERKTRKPRENTRNSRKLLSVDEAVNGKNEFINVLYENASEAEYNTRLYGCEFYLKQYKLNQNDVTLSNYYKACTYKGSKK